MHFQLIRQILLLFTIICSISNVIGQQGQTVNIAQYIQSATNLSTLRQIISSPGSANLLALLNSPTSRVTLFAPVDGAFTGVDITNATFASDLIKYHTVPDRVISSKDITSNLVANTLLNSSSLINLPLGQGQVLYLTKSLGGNITINNANTPNAPISVIQADIQCTNGVVHLINAVVTPPRSLVDTANSLGLTQFINAYTDANLLSNSNQSSGITIFIPTNDAFSKSNVSSMESMEKKALLQRHVIVSKVIYEIKDGMNEDKLHFTVNDTIYVNNGKVEKSDILLKNGVMYIVNNVLSFDEGGVKKNRTKPNTTEPGYEGNTNHKTDKKLIAGTVLGTICGVIVITLFSCMLFKWFRARQNADRYRRNYFFYNY